MQYTFLEEQNPLCSFSQSTGSEALSKNIAASNVSEISCSIWTLFLTLKEFLSNRAEHNLIFLLHCDVLNVLKSNLDSNSKSEFKVILWRQEARVHLYFFK